MIRRVSLTLTAVAAATILAKAASIPRHSPVVEIPITTVETPLTATVDTQPAATVETQAAATVDTQPAAPKPSDAFGASAADRSGMTQRTSLLGMASIWARSLWMRYPQALASHLYHRVCPPSLHVYNPLANCRLDAHACQVMRTGTAEEAVDVIFALGGVHAMEDGGVMALYLAVSEFNVPVVELLLAMDVPVIFAPSGTFAVDLRVVARICARTPVGQAKCQHAKNAVFTMLHLKADDGKIASDGQCVPLRPDSVETDTTLRLFVLGEDLEMLHLVRTQHGINLDRRLADGYTLLLYAAAVNRPRALAHLLSLTETETGATLPLDAEPVVFAALDAVAPQNVGGWSPLMLAVANGSEEMTRALTGHGATRVTYETTDGEGALQLAFRIKDGAKRDVILRLLRPTLADDATIRGWRGQTAPSLQLRAEYLAADPASKTLTRERLRTHLMAALKLGSASEVRAVVALGAVPNGADKNETTQLFSAIFETAKPSDADLNGIVECLRRAGLQFDWTETTPRSPYLVALQDAKCATAVAALIKHGGCAVNRLLSSTTTPPVLVAITHANVEAVRRLLGPDGKAVCNYTMAGPGTRTLIHYAISRIFNDELALRDIVEFLLYSGVALEAVDKNPAPITAKAGHDYMALDYNDQYFPTRDYHFIKLTTGPNRTHLMYAVAHNRLATVRLLIARGANEHYDCGDGVTPLSFAKDLLPKELRPAAQRALGHDSIFNWIF